jgi:uncharacterized protein (DUF58 family)
MALTGRAALFALAGCLAVAWAPGWTTLLAWLLIGVVLVAIDLALAASIPQVTIERTPLPVVRLGESVETSLHLVNRGSRRLRGVLRDAWQPSAGATGERHRLDLPAGDRVDLVTVLTPTRRWDRTVESVTVRSLGPLGLAARQATLPCPGVVRVLLPFASRRHLPTFLSRLRELDGRTAVNVRGRGTEFDSLRDYVIGDDVRSIDWRASARRQQVVVRTWRPERDRRVLLVLDTSRTSAARIGTEPRLDAAMDAALLLAALANRAGDRVDLIAADRRVRARVSGATGSALVPALVQAMAPLEPELVEADWTTIVAAVRARLTQRALVVLLTPLDAAAVEEGLLPVIPRLTRRHQVIVASVSDPRVDEMASAREDGYQVYGAAAAERARMERAATVAELGRYGVEVVDSPPQTLPPALADRYLSLKAAGRL